jgi:hypothetical protein
LQEFNGGEDESAQQIIKLAQRKHVIFLKKEKTGAMEVGGPLVCGWLG